MIKEEVIWLNEFSSLEEERQKVGLRKSLITQLVGSFINGS